MVLHVWPSHVQYTVRMPACLPAYSLGAPNGMDACVATVAGGDGMAADSDDDDEEEDRR